MKNLVTLSLSLAAAFALASCEPVSRFSRLVDGEGPIPEDLTDPSNPFEDPRFNPGGGIPGGTNGQTTTDFFSQSLVGKSDILFVVDNSGSMQNDQVSLQQNINLLVEELSKASVDYRIAVIKTAAADDDSLKHQCGSEYISSNNASDLANCMLVGTAGPYSGHETAFEAARRALDPQYPKGPWNPGVQANPLNPGFIRSDASLNIVTISDEDDQPTTFFDTNDIRSWGYFGFSLDDVNALRQEMAPTLIDGGMRPDRRHAFFPKLENYLTFFKGLKSSTEPEMAFHAVVGTTLDESACDPGKSVAFEVGKRYVAMAQLTGGSTAEICKDMGPVLQELGLRATGLKKCFGLSKIPEQPSSISVKVDNMTIDTSDVTYVPTGNQACLSRFPEAGASITITYR